MSYVETLDLEHQKALERPERIARLRLLLMYLGDRSGDIPMSDNQAAAFVAEGMDILKEL